MDIRAGGGEDEVSYNVNAPVSIDGGTGFDKIVVLGTEFADDIVITAKGIFGAGLNVRYTTVEVVEVDGLEGDDEFFVQSTAFGVAYRVIGGLGLATRSTSRATSSRTSSSASSRASAAASTTASRSRRPGLRRPDRRRHRPQRRDRDRQRRHHRDRRLHLRARGRPDLDRPRTPCGLAAVARRRRFTSPSPPPARSRRRPTALAPAAANAASGSAPAAARRRARPGRLPARAIYVNGVAALRRRPRRGADLHRRRTGTSTSGSTCSPRTTCGPRATASSPSRTAVISKDARYDGTAVRNVEVTVRDNDTPGVYVVEVGHGTTIEDRRTVVIEGDGITGLTDDLLVRLGAWPGVRHRGRRARAGRREPTPRSRSPGLPAGEPDLLGTPRPARSPSTRPTGTSRSA